ncbi:hypothetical protein HG535_0E00270 [Zygotorulaspora mrakii]|uniref:Protein GLC8 n=1 Tax=Zygotorulaspora mrakii TaxID=42260 RepID=A0A7H9B379_ZYGMR|nr:uncharacterized protein HG535_0E00270 [Zygotorulaspora mrakii]QLG72943.1 hypothetical protein HG535_0E00270 [Zygotorulaspora mrakii]
MGGILKNPLPQEQNAVDAEESIADFRKQVYENTQLNAQLTSSKGGGGSISGMKNLPKDILSLKHQQEAEEQLQWNQRNLDENEITKKQYQDIHVDEPKTPYQGAVDPEGEYYKADDEVDLDDFSLGEAEYKMNDNKEADFAIQDPKPTPDSSKSQDELDAEEKHRRFQEMRKKHYNIKEALQEGSLSEDEET